jgi:uncharacterized protein involved in exopolysaccharide biosynthesis/Mrp family chromosome partitioning ATPase
MQFESVSDGGFSRVGERDLDFGALGRALWRKKWSIFGPAIAVAVIAFVVVNILTPKYKSEARILIEPRENAFSRPDADKTGERAQFDMEAVTSQVQILTSRDLALKVIKDLELADRAEFDSIKKGVSVSSLMLGLLGLSKDPRQLTPEERVLAAYYDRLNIVAIEKSRVIQIEFQSSDPELATRVANAIADAYLNLQQQAKQSQTRGASQWLAGEIDRLREKVGAAEQRAEDFRAQSDLYSGPSSSSLISQQLSELTTQLGAARAQKAELDAKSSNIRAMLRSGKQVESADITNSDLLRRLIEQRVTLRSQLSEQSATLLHLHPRIQELSAQINALDAQIRGELERLVRSIENDATIAAARIETTSLALDQVKRQLAGSTSQDVQLRALEREAKAERDLLESYLAKYREATARDSLDAAPADARIISRATLSNLAAFPKKGAIVLIATLGMLFLAGAFIISGEILSGGGPILPHGRTATLGSAAVAAFSSLRRSKPVPAPAPVRPAAASSSMQIAELAQTLRHSGESARRITVAGTTRNVGTTYTAIGLARALAQGARVVLVELAISAPNLSIMAVDPDAPGLADLVRGTANVGDIITRDKFSRVHLVGVGRVGGEGAAILSSARVATTLEALARSYDHVVIDAGAVPEMAVESLARLAPRAVLVAAEIADPAALAARDRLLAAGFIDVIIFPGTPPGPDTVAAAHPDAA